MVLKFYQEQLVYICLIKNKTTLDTEIPVYWNFTNYYHDIIFDGQKEIYKEC